MDKLAWTIIYDEEVHYMHKPSEVKRYQNHWYALNESEARRYFDDWSRENKLTTNIISVKCQTPISPSGQEKT